MSEQMSTPCVTTKVEETVSDDPLKAAAMVAGSNADAFSPAIQKVACPPNLITFMACLGFVPKRLMDEYSSGQPSTLRSKAEWRANTVKLIKSYRRFVVNKAVDEFHRDGALSTVF
jgi:hypothetical protein